ncbi:MAG TPA: hypothetical protein VN496_16535 [Burkholderiales bacterium]|nr:hypothetical protein [Burkholderiales bacterium]
MQEKKLEIGDYVIAVKALYSPDIRKWQPILRISRRMPGSGESVHQDFTLLPALSKSEADAIEYGLTKGRLLVTGTVMGLTI